MIVDQNFNCGGYPCFCSNSNTYSAKYYISQMPNSSSWIWNKWHKPACGRPGRRPNTFPKRHTLHRATRRAARRLILCAQSALRCFPIREFHICQISLNIDNYRIIQKVDNPIALNNHHHLFEKYPGLYRRYGGLLIR